MKSAHYIEDEELIRSAKEGKPEALTMVYERYLGMVYNRVRYSIPEEDVEDVTQEIFIAAIRSLKGFRGEAKFSTWLRTLTVRQIAEYYRRNKHMNDVELDENMSDEQDHTANEDAILIRQAFRKLPEKYKEVLLLRFAEGLPFQEIANIQGCSLEAIKSLFRRAVAAIHKQVGTNG